MGTGNWSLEPGVTVILEPDNDDPFWWEDFRDNVRESLSVMWCEVLDKWRGRDAKIIFQSGLCEIVTHVDSYDHLFVCFHVRPDIDRPELAHANYEKWAQAFFDKMQKEFYPDMRVATSAWTSAPRQTQEQRIANR